MTSRCAISFECRNSIPLQISKTILAASERGLRHNNTNWLVDFQYAQWRIYRVSKSQHWNGLCKKNYLKTWDNIRKNVDFLSLIALQCCKVNRLSRQYGVLSNLSLFQNNNKAEVWSESISCHFLKTTPNWVWTTYNDFFKLYIELYQILKVYFKDPCLWPIVYIVLVNSAALHPSTKNEKVNCHKSVNWNIPPRTSLTQNKLVNNVFNVP